MHLKKLFYILLLTYCTVHVTVYKTLGFLIEDLIENTIEEENEEEENNKIEESFVLLSNISNQFFAKYVSINIIHYHRLSAHIIHSVDYQNIFSPPPERI